MKNYVAAFREICKFCLCDNCKMYDACINYPGRISAWSEDMVNKIIEDICANGTEEELKVLEKYSLDSLKME